MEDEFVNPTFIRDLPSDTKASAVHIKWKNRHFRITIADHRRYGIHTSCFEASNRGKADQTKMIFSYRGNDMDEGIDYLLDILHGKIESPKKEPIYQKLDYDQYNDSSKKG
jgi:hypothetical protein